MRRISKQLVTSLGRATCGALAVALAVGCASGTTQPAIGDDDDDVVGDDDDSNREEPGLGCRSVSISTGKDGAGAAASAFFTSAIGQNTDTSEFLDAEGWKVGGALVLCAGLPNGDKAEVTLQSDVTFAVSLPLGNCLCRDYLAAGSEGTLYCAAHADLLDVKRTVDSNGTAAGGSPTWVDGPGAVTGEGHLRMSFQSRAANIDAEPDQCTPQACASALHAESPGEIRYTTGRATSEITEARQGGTVSIVAEGRAFGTCTDWAAGGSAGSLAGAHGHEEDNSSTNKDVVTVERIAAE